MTAIRSPEVIVTPRPAGGLHLRATHALPPYPVSLTERLGHWAATAPDRIFLTEPDGRTLNYADAWNAVQSIAGALQARPLSAERPVMILSGNDIDHAVMGLACLNAGIPYAPVSTAYALLSADFAKLRSMVALLTPGLVFVSDAAPFRAALDTAIPPGTEIVAARNGRAADTPFAEMNAPAQPAHVTGDTIAKFLFTSGSTGTPKAVINTHRMLCANQAMIAAHLPFLTEEPPIILDWLPWSHTFGGNNNFNMVLFHGGTLHIDAGRPIPGHFAPTIRALRTVFPTVHMSVPRAWEMLTTHLRADPDLNRRFHARLRLPFYAAASLPQPVWEQLAALSREATGTALPMLTGLGSTETAPMAFCNGPDVSAAGHVGLPVAGLDVALVPTEGKLEARLRGPSITPGYWRNPVRTAEAFDEDGYYRTGDALAWVDPANPGRGLRFDGRLAEDFKLTSGTWVSVGPLRATVLAALQPWVQDVVIAGHDRDYLAVLALPGDPVAPETISEALSQLAARAPGGAARIMRLAFLATPPSMDAGEITDKGSLNQRAILARRPAELAALYAEPPPPHVIRVQPEA